MAVQESYPVVRLSELLGAMSQALDMTEGLPPGHAVRACWIGANVGAAMGLSGQSARDLFYSILLKDAGCSSNAARIGSLYLTDDLAFKAAHKVMGTSTIDALGFVLKRTGRDSPLSDRLSAVLNIMNNADTITCELIDTRCQRGADIARRLRFPEAVAASVAALDEHWDGHGRPRGLKGQDIPLYARIALLSQVVEVFHASEGRDAAAAEVGRRTGTWFDPAVAAAFDRVRSDPAFWDALVHGVDVTRFPAFAGEAFADDAQAVDEEYLDDVAAAFAFVVDAKTPFTKGHSDRVGEFADLIASNLGFDAPRRRRLRRAALLHDIGKLGVSNTLLDKPGRLTDEEWVAMRAHPVKSEAILSRIAAFADAARIGGDHHERLDGKGYPRGIGADQIGIETRIVTVADVFDALTADRPYRAAMTVEAALAIMDADVGTALDPECMDALKRGLAKVDVAVPLAA